MTLNQSIEYYQLLMINNEFVELIFYSLKVLKASDYKVFRFVNRAELFQIQIETCFWVFLIFIEILEDFQGKVSVPSVLWTEVFL